METQDILNEIANAPCFSCRKEKTEIVRLSEKKALTKNLDKICQTPGCSFFINFSEVKNWIIFNSHHYQRDLKSQNSPDFNPKLSRRLDQSLISENP